MDLTLVTRTSTDKYCIGPIFNKKDVGTIIKPMYMCEDCKLIGRLCPKNSKFKGYEVIVTEPGKRFTKGIEIALKLTKHFDNLGLPFYNRVTCGYICGDSAVYITECSDFKNDNPDVDDQLRIIFDVLNSVGYTNNTLTLDDFVVYKRPVKLKYKNLSINSKHTIKLKENFYGSINI